NISKFSVGEFDSTEWMKQGNALLLSARTLRLSWTLNRRKIKKLFDSNQLSLSEENQVANVDLSLSGPSLLLVGYATEMFLKASLAKVMVGTSEQLFSNLARVKFSHNLIDLAIFVGFRVDKQTTQDLADLQNYIVHEGRYPLSASNPREIGVAFSERRRRSTDAVAFRRYCRLARELARHSTVLAGTPGDPVSHSAWILQDDGYVSYRSGGGLPPRITYRMSSALEDDSDPYSALEQMARSIPLLDKEWSNCDLYEEIVELKVSLKAHRKNGARQPSASVQVLNMAPR
ncbi:MAG: hypothetical protein WBZ57_04595, partial [Pseudomonas graminis]